MSPPADTAKAALLFNLNQHLTPKNYLPFITSIINNHLTNNCSITNHQSITTEHKPPLKVHPGNPELSSPLTALKEPCKAVSLCFSPFYYSAEVILLVSGQ